MKLILNRDYFDNPTPPRVFLCTTGKKRIQELQATNRGLNGKWAAYSEFSFETQRTYVDLIDGETKIHPAYDKIEAPRMIFVENYGYWCIQDVDDASGDIDVKSISCFSSEYAVSNKYLTNWHINTGEIDSVEVLYNESQFGLDYSTDRDSFYKFASGDFDAFESYYKRNYTDSDSYTYEQIQVANADEYAKLLKASNDPDGQLSEKLYVKNYPNVQFYNENRTGLSLLHLIFDYIPEWKLGNVDKALWHKERRFSENRISIYDFLMNNVSETFDCTFVWDSLTGLVHVYENADDDDEIINEASTRWETDVYVSKDNLASECNVSYSADNIKTKLVVTGSDNLDIREVNLGGNSIMDLSFYHTEDWMERDLYDRYNAYLEELREAETGLDRYGLPSAKYTMSYPDAMRGWVEANNKYHELMHSVPTEENILLVGDKFKKLFCICSPIDNAYAKETIQRDIAGSTVWVENLYYDKRFQIPIKDATDGQTYVVQGFKLIYNSIEKKYSVDNTDSLRINSTNTLVKKLNQYHVYEDIKGNKNDNILLKLKNSNSDIATIRIYDPKTRATTYDISHSFNYYIKGDNDTYEMIDVLDQEDFDKKMQELDNGLYTNNYTIQLSIVYAKEGNVSGATSYWSMVLDPINGITPQPFSKWIRGEITAENLGEELGFVRYAESDISKEAPIYNYEVASIGTMGAYFVLAKDEVVATDNGVLEVSENYLKKCGVNLLKEKHKIYTSIFQTQTEGMLSQEKYQCIVQDEKPTGVYPEGTRWLDTNSSPIKLYVYKPATATTSAEWSELIDPNNQTVSTEDRYNYENYQRYLDNYNKLKAVQKQLVEKEREVAYCTDGYKVDYVVDLSDGSSLPEVMERIAKKHIDEIRATNSITGNYTIAGRLVNSDLPLYTFTTSFDPIVYQRNTEPYNSIEQYYTKHETMDVYSPIEITNKEEFDKKIDETTLYVMTSGHTFALYSKDGEFCVSYNNAQGLYNMVMEYIRNETDMSNPKFFNKDQWIRLSPFIKEDEFNDNNFLLTGYESEEERISICKELMEAAKKELKTLCKPSLEFSMTMANILALPEFSPLMEQFQLGNFIRVEIRDGYVKRARLLEVNLNFDDLSSFDCTFGNLKTTRSEIDKHADLLSQAITAGKQVAKSSNSWQRAVEKTNKLEDDINAGLQDASLKIKNASGQSIEIGENGLIGRKLIEGTTNQYEDEQVAIINNKLVFTSDNWNTSKACFGKFAVDGQDRWGVLSDAVVSGYIQGSIIDGGSLKIGGTGGQFIVNSDGSVQILGPRGEEKYAGDRFKIDLEYTGSTVFSDFNDECVIDCFVYDTTLPMEEQDITSKVIEIGGTFIWNRSMAGWTISDRNIIKDADGNPIVNKISITRKDIERNATFACTVSFDETKLDIQGGASE